MKKTLTCFLFFSLICEARVRLSGWCQQGGVKVSTNSYLSVNKFQQSYPGATVNVYYTGGPSGTVTTSGTAVTWASGTLFNANSGWTGLSITINSVSYTIASVSSTNALTLTSSAGTQSSPVAYSMSGTAPAAIFSDNIGTALSNPFSCDIVTAAWGFYADSGTYDIRFSGIGISVPFTISAITITAPAAQPLGPTDTPTFGGLTLNGTLTMNGTIAMGSNVITGTHIQNVGTGDSPTFAGATVTGAISATGGISSSNGSGYSYSAIQSGSGGAYYAAIQSGSLFTGSTTASSMFHLTDSGGSCTLSAANGMVCTGTQAVKTTSTPTFAGLTLTGSMTGVASSWTGAMLVSANSGSPISSIVNTGAGEGLNIVATIGTGLHVAAGGANITSTYAAPAMTITSSYAYSANFTDTGGTCRMGFASGGVTCPSDRRLKHAITPLNSTLDGVMNLRPVAFAWNSTGERADGLIAQEVQKIFPLAVHQGDDGLLNISYQQLVPYLIRSIQEMQMEIIQLRKQVKAR